MQLGDFLTCVLYRLPGKVIVSRNDTLGLIKWEQMIFLGNPEYGVKLASLDFVKFAEACGARAVRIDDPNRCRAQLQEALSWERPAIVECAPLPAKVTQKQAEHLFEALRAGTPNRKRIALQIVKDELEESSFQASPAPKVPSLIGDAASTLVDAVLSRSQKIDEHPYDPNQ